MGFGQFRQSTPLQCVQRTEHSLPTLQPHRLPQPDLQLQLIISANFSDIGGLLVNTDFNSSSSFIHPHLHGSKVFPFHCCNV